MTTDPAAEQMAEAIEKRLEWEESQGKVDILLRDALLNYRAERAKPSAIKADPAIMPPSLRYVYEKQQRGERPSFRDRLRGWNW